MGYLLLLIFFVLPSNIHAQEMFSPSYRLEMEQVEATTEAKLQSLNSLQLKNFLQEGYVIQTPKDDILQLSISDTIINLNSFENEPIQEHSFLNTVVLSDVSGYQLLAIPMQGLESLSGDQIPPTVCDKQSCNYQSARIWTIPTSYGWGYSVSGPDSSSDFVSNKYYRPFKTGESVVIATQDATNTQRSTEVTIKTVVDANLPEGNYTSLIKLVALPKL